MEKIFPLCRDVIAFMGSKAPDMETVFLAYSKKATNAFGINDGTPGGDFRGAGLYLGLSVHNHACDSECWVVCSGPKLLLRTTNKQMKYSENLTICYPSGDFIRNTILRRLKLHTSFFFTCMCPECFELELNRNRLAGRSGCCSKGWFPGVAYEFHITEEKCSECGKRVPEERVHKVLEANKKLGIAIAEHDFKPEEVDEFDLIDRYIKLYEDNKEILSEHNVNLIGCTEIIYSSALHRNLLLAVKYVDISLPMIRQRPAGLNRSMGLCRRYMLYDMARKPLGEVRKACEEALKTVELVYGEKHELTAQMRLKAMELKFATQFGMR